MREPPPLIVVVDDEPRIAELLKRLLEKQGYEVAAFTDGASALPAVLARRPDLLLTDVRMPGLDGLTLMKRARAVDRELAVVLITAYASVDTAVEAFRGEADGFIMKPFSFEEIRRVVGRIVDGRRHDRERRRLQAELSIANRELRQHRDRLSAIAFTARSDLHETNRLLARRLNDFEILHEIAELTSRVDEPADPWPLVSRLIRDKLSVDGVIVLERDATAPVFLVRAVEGLSPALRAGEPLEGAERLLPAAEDPKAEIPADLRPLLGSGETLVTRIDAEHGPPAVLLVTRAPGLAAFDEEDRTLLRLIAHDLALSLENRRLLRKTEDDYFRVLETLAAATEDRHTYLRGHSRHVRALASAFAAFLGMSWLERDSIDHGAAIHDLGKIGIPDCVLDKPGPLDEREWEEIRLHPARGAELVRFPGELRGARRIVRHHHEHWNGRGYPDRLAESAIPLTAQVVSICDAWDAMTSPRPYRAALPPDDARSRLRSAAGTQFDPHLVEALADFLRTDPGREVAG